MKRIIAYLLFIFMGIQIIFGVVYVVTNLTVIQDFPESFSFPLPIGILYLFQAAFSGLSIWYVLGKFGLSEKKVLRGFITAFLLTVPFLLQLHMAALRWSVSLSLFLFMTGLAIETGRTGLNRQKIVLLGSIYFIYGLLCPDGIWLGGVLLFAVPVFFRGEGGQESDRKPVPPRRERLSEDSRKWKLPYAGLVLAAACLIFAANLGLNKVMPEKREYYRYNTVSYAALQRFVWPNFGTHYYFWSDEVKEVLSLEDAVEISHRVDAVERDFIPALEKRYGRERAKQLCMQMARSCLKYRTREITAEILTDLKDYLLVPFTIEGNLKGEGSSLTGWNYGRMKAHTPVLVKYYYQYAFLELPVLLLVSLLLRFLQRRNKVSAEWKLLLFSGIFYAAWYALKSNIPMDHKLVLPVLFIWYLAAAMGLIYAVEPAEHHLKG